MFYDDDDDDQTPDPVIDSNDVGMPEIGEGDSFVEDEIL